MRAWLAGLALVVVAGGCASLPAAGPGRGRDDVVRHILASTVQLRSEREGGARRAGSGVVIASDPRGRRSWILTTRHLLEPASRQTLLLTVPGRKPRWPAQVVALSKDVDLAVVAVDGVALPAVELRDAASLGDEILVVGFPWGKRLTVVSGIVSQIVADDGELAFTGPVRMVDASVSYGSSGGGVFHAASGMLVGIVEGYRTARLTVQASPERTVDIPVPGETTLLATPAIRRFIEEAGLDLRDLRVGTGAGTPGGPAP